MKPSTTPAASQVAAPGGGFACSPDFRLIGEPKATQDNLVALQPAKRRFGRGVVSQLVFSP